MSPQTRPKAFAQVIARRKRIVGLSILAGVFVSMVAYQFSPKSYKVQATISIPTQYFQVPMVSDFVPQTYDETELRSERGSLVRESLDYDYLRGLTSKFHLLGDKSDSTISSYELYELGKKFEIVNLNAMTFLVSYTASDPVLGYRVLNDYLDHLRKTIETDRRVMLSQLRNAIKDQLELLAFGGKGGGAGVMLSRPDLVREEADREEKELKQLRSIFSDKHPRVIELEAKLAKLAQYLKPKGNGKEVAEESFSGARVDPGSQELFRDFLKKFHYISVVMYMDSQNRDSYLIQLQEPYVPKAAIWPKRPLFFAWGIAMGFLIGALLALAEEVRDERRVGERHAPHSATMMRVAQPLGVKSVPVVPKRVPVPHSSAYPPEEPPGVLEE